MITESVTIALQELKATMPVRYQRQLAKRLEKGVNPVPLWRIKKAFAGYSQPEKVVQKIFTTAVKMSEQQLSKAAKIQSTTKKISQQASKLK